ncbi:helix-turn-helix transcriptional regulator [Amycolatopsis minnesotensis]
MSADRENVGRRVRAARKLVGMTQGQLARHASFSESLVKKVEAGSAPPSPAFVAGCAKALGVKVAALYGTLGEEVVSQPSDDANAVAELRSALDAWDDPRPEGQPVTLDALVQRLDVVSKQVLRLDHADAAYSLARSFHHLYVIADDNGRAGEQARSALHDAYRLAATVAGRLRQADLAAIASERHVQLAGRTGEPTRVAISAFHRTTRHLQYGDYRTGLRVLDRAREHVGTSSADRAVSVQLDLRAAVLSARAGDQDEADGYLDRARALSAEHALPAEPFFGIDASSTNIAVHWCATPVEGYDGTEAVRRAGMTPVVDRKRPERVGHHHIDMARAWVLHGDREHALGELNAARQVAPRATRNHPSVRETVFALATRDRRATDSLAEFARWAGIQLT